MRAVYLLALYAGVTFVTGGTILHLTESNICDCASIEISYQSWKGRTHSVLSSSDAIVV
jgi:hypothetical protein